MSEQSTDISFQQGTAPDVVGHTPGPWEVQSIPSGGLTPLDLPGNRDAIQYFGYKCVGCGEDARNTFSEPYRTRMLENRHCWNCDFWADQERKLERNHASMTIIDGHIYSPGNRTSGSFRGMAGRRFDIEYIEPSVHAGKRISTFDLWSGSTMPDRLRAKFADTAKFLNGAERAKAGETTCWNQSSTRDEPYPLPMSLGIGK